MFYNKLRKLTLPLCVLAAITASAGVFSPLPETTTARTSARSLNPGAVYLPKAVDKNGAISPDITIGAPYFRTSNTTGTLTAPGGEEWFYTLDLEGIHRNPGNPYFVDMDFTGFHLHVFDTQMNPIGEVKGTINRPEGTLKCYSVDVAPLVTTNFFNYNSTDYEVMFSFTFNPDKDENGVQRYGAKETTQAYTITKTIPAGGSKLLFETDGYFTTAVNMSSSLSEDYVMTFIEDTSWDGEDVYNSHFVIYKKGGYGTSPQEIQRFTIPKLFVMADGNNEAMPFAIKRHGNDLYIATARYEKTFFKDPTAAEPEQNTDNNYIITLYKKNGDSFEVQTATKIPVGTPAEGFYYRSCALGNFMGFDDLTFDFGDGTTPGYIITVVDADNTDNTSAHYVYYDINGNAVKTFGEDSDSYVIYEPFKNLPRQIAFYMTASDGNYGFVVNDYPSFTESAFVPTLFEYDADAWSLTSVPARTVTADGVRYVATVQPASGSISSSHQYIGWFMPDGTLDRVDTLNFGQNIAKVLLYIHESVLNPYLFHTDKNAEYLAWVYRYTGVDSETSLELAIVSNTGEIIASRKLSGSHSYELATVTNPYTDPSLVITYKANDITENPYQFEYISLPLNGLEGKGTVESPYIIKTFGDLNLIRKNLTAHYRLANSIDCSGQNFLPIEGDFTGSLDGGNFDIRNLSVEGLAMFKNFGHYALYGETPVTAKLSNVNFVNPSVVYNGSARFNVGVVSATMNSAELVNVNLINPSIKSSGNVCIGGITGYANNVSIRHSYVSGAEFNAPSSIALGGLFGELRNGSISTVAVSGNLAGKNFVGGLVGKSDFGDITVTDCHINAEISGETYVGGMAGIWQREPVKRVFVEGSLSGNDYIGGITGAIALPDSAVPEGSDFKIIDNCLVGLESITAPSNAKYVHRIFGYSLLDAGDRLVWVPSPTNPEVGEYVETPAQEESKIGNNYVVTELDAIGAETLISEGTLNTFDIFDSDWMADLGFAFADWASEASETTPWVYGNTSWMPELYFEETAGASLHIVDADVTGKVGQKVTAILMAANVDFDNLQYESTNNAVAELADLTLGANGEVNVEIELKAIGQADIVFSYGAMHRTVVHVTVVDSAPVLSFREEAIEQPIGAFELILDFDNTTVEEISAVSSDDNTVGVNSIVSGSRAKEAIVALDLKKPGTAEITATAGAATAKITVTVKTTTGSGTESISVNVLSYNGREVIAEACAIEVYNMQGRLVAAGESRVSVADLAAGIYIARAVNADGMAATLKINR